MEVAAHAGISAALAGGPLRMCGGKCRTCDQPESEKALFFSSFGLCVSFFLASLSLKKYITLTSLYISTSKQDQILDPSPSIRNWPIVSSSTL